VVYRWTSGSTIVWRGAELGGVVVERSGVEWCDIVRAVIDYRVAFSGV